MMNKDLIIKLSVSALKTLPKNYVFDYKSIPNVFVKQVADKFGAKTAYIVCIICSKSISRNVSLTDAYDFVLKNLKVLIYVDFGHHTNKYECYECDGTGIGDYCGHCIEGNKDCDECDGSGEISCEYCDGSGEAEDEGYNCNNCNGSGNQMCDNCLGDGYTVCSECDGDGRIACEYCNGDGYNIDDARFIDVDIHAIITDDDNIINPFVKSLEKKTNLNLNYKIDIDSFFENIEQYRRSTDNICYHIKPEYTNKDYPIFAFNILVDNIKIVLVDKRFFVDGTRNELLLDTIVEKFTDNDE